jgi:hypothetical protein
MEQENVVEEISPEIPEDANEQARQYAQDQKDRAEVAVKESAVLRKRMIGYELKDIGLDSEAGLGVAIAESYEGDFAEGSVAQFAVEKYKYEVPGATVPVETVTEPQERLEALDAESSPVTPEVPVDPQAQAEAAMNSPDGTRDDAVASLTHKLAGLDFPNT